MTATVLVTHGTICHLLTHKEHAIEMIESIIKETDLDPCAKQTVEDLGTLGLFDLSKALVHMTVLQDRSVAQESVISRLRKRNETLTNEQEQYKGAFRTLNKEVMALTKKLKEEAYL